MEIRILFSDGLGSFRRPCHKDHNLAIREGHFVFVRGFDLWWLFSCLVVC